MRSFFTDFDTRQGYQTGYTFVVGLSLTKLKLVSLSLYKTTIYIKGKHNIILNSLSRTKISYFFKENGL